MEGNPPQPPFKLATLTKTAKRWAKAEITEADLTEDPYPGEYTDSLQHIYAYHPRLREYIESHLKTLNNRSYLQGTGYDYRIYKIDPRGGDSSAWVLYKLANTLGF
ncbi:hypothetical protein TWF506_004070 [Arthrobotrys conoides]|uniref:Uncharacterized protein n=1 Tax=Arthrobotrys conoides TaxID=74498 RepID=A0AAN8MXD4_9PEZI